MERELWALIVSSLRTLPRRSISTPIHRSLLRCSGRLCITALSTGPVNDATGLPKHGVENCQINPP